MKNIDDIILNSLRLINYDRSKHITEQKNPTVAKKVVAEDAVKVKNVPFTMGTPELQGEKKVWDEINKYAANPIYTPGIESVDNENDIPYLTYKSVVNGKNIYLPQKSVDPSFIAFLKKNKYAFELLNPFDDPNKTISTKIKILENKVIKEITTSEPFNQEIAENYFGSQCLKLSGKHPKYDVGYVKDLDYYVDDSGTQCSPIPYKTITKNSVGKDGKSTTTTEVDVFQLDLPKPVTLKNGNNIQKSKFKYPKGCNPMGYQFCLVFSWKSLYANGSQDLAVLEFEESSGSSSIKVGSAGVELSNKITTTYRGCLTDEWYPWTNSFVGYLNKSNFKIGTDSAGKKQYTKCVRNGYSTTGVNLIEDYLSKYNFQSGVKTLDFVSNNKVLQFTLPEAIKKSTGSDFKLSGNLINYTVDLNQWFTWGSKDYKTYNAGMNINFQDYLNNVDEERGLYDDYLGDLYGVERKDKNGNILVDNEFGVKEWDQMLNNEKTLAALNAKWDDIAGKGDYYSILIKISDDYSDENNKPKKNNLVLSYLESQWNKTLGESRIKGSEIYNEKMKSSGVKFEYQTIDQFTILYLNYFDIVDTTNKNVNDTISGNSPKSGDNYIGKVLNTLPTVKSFKFGLDILNPYKEKPPVDVKSGLESIFHRDKPKKIGYGVLPLKIYENQEIDQISRTYPLMVPSDYSKYTKKAKPVTILDAKDRAKLEGPTNGFKYQDQAIDIEGVLKMTSNQYTYQSIVNSLPNTINSEEKNQEGGETTPEELEIILASYKQYDEDISKVINNTIVLIGR